MISVLAAVEAATVPRRKRENLIDRLQARDVTFTTSGAEGMVP